MIMADIIQVTGLQKSYNSRMVLSNIDFNVRKGECFCLLGPNGAGKTTTLRILTGFLSADKGSVRLSDIDVLKNPQKLKGKLNIIPQYPALDPLLSVRENLIFFGLLQKMSRKYLFREVDELLKVFEIDRIRNHVTFHCSGGEYQRLTVARAFLKPTDILFMDEPTSGIDILFKNQLWDYFKRKQQEGLTIFLNTHDLNEAEVLSDRIAFLFNGRIIAINTPEKLKKSIEGIKIYVELENISLRSDIIADLKKITIDIGIDAGKKILKLRAPAIDLQILNILNRLAVNNKIITLEIQQPTLNDVFKQLGVNNVADTVA
jgi:ABC-2 type transport system ATP-binding protein